MAAGNDTHATNKWRFFFSLGVIFLVLMAILWGADRSFRYITIGFAAYFIFLALWKKPRAVENSPADEAFDQLKDDLKTIFAKKRKTYKSPRTTARAKNPGVIAIAGIFIFFVFTLITLAVVFLSDDRQAGNEQAGRIQDGSEEIARLREALAGDPQNTNTLIDLGNGFLETNQYDSALKYYEEAIGINESEKAAHYNIALVYFLQEKYGSSLSRLKKILWMDPEYQIAMALTGDNYYAEQDYDSALYWYEETYRRGERNPDLTHRLAYIYDTKKNTVKAVMFYKETVNLDSSRSEVYTRLGQLLEGEEAQRYRDLAAKYDAN